MATLQEIYDAGAPIIPGLDAAMKAADVAMAETEKVIEETAAAVNAAQFAYVRALKNRIRELEAENAALRAASSSVGMSAEAFYEAAKRGE